MNGNKYCPSSNVPSDVSMMIHVYEEKRLGTKKIEENCAKRNAVGKCGFFKRVNMKISLSCDVTLGRLVAGDQCFYQTPQHHIHSTYANAAVLSISLEQNQHINRCFITYELYHFQFQLTGSLAH
jgi:hypothetical protein